MDGHSLNMSMSQASISSKFDMKMHRSQLNLENRMKEDFERL
jgi:hypothetical protein